MENACLSEVPFFNARLWKKGHRKIEFTEKLLWSKLIFPPIERLVLCKASTRFIWGAYAEYMEGIPGELDKYFKKNERNLIILNDLMDEASKILKITQLFTCSCHDKLFLIYLMEKFFHKNQRALSLNSDYMVIFKNPRESSQFATIARQICLDKLKFLLFMWAYKDATSSLHTYLMLDSKSDTEERLWKIHNLYIAHWKRKRIICNVNMVMSACLRTLRRIWLCW